MSGRCVDCGGVVGVATALFCRRCQGVLREDANLGLADRGALIRELRAQLRAVLSERDGPRGYVETVKNLRQENQRMREVVAAALPPPDEGEGGGG